MTPRLAVILMLLAIRPAAGATTCATLASAALPGTTITRAQLVPAGRFASTTDGVLAPGAAAFKPYSALPEFCRVAATLTPSADSDIKIEVWMPATGWNGRFQAIGNGAWAGALMIQPLAVALGRGYAVTTTDTGHTERDGSFAFSHPEKLVDFADRAVHLMATQAKALIGAFYSKPPVASYWTGCSTGGRQGLIEAQRYPADFDGIVAGDPTNDMTHMFLQQMWVTKVALANSAGGFSKEKAAVLHQAVVDACDARDGVRDGVIDDPTRCAFDPAALLCKTGDGPACLTEGEVATARAMYDTARNARTGVEVFPGFAKGSEAGWPGLIGGPKPFNVPEDFFKFVVFKNPAWNFRTLNMDTDVARAEAADGGRMDATDPDLSAFVARGGKLLMYHGWSDPLVSPQNSVNYYERVARLLGSALRVSDSVRLFMAPGMSHCAGGDGPSNFDSLNLVEQWVEQKIAPDQIVASHLTGGKVDRTRPLCPYPQLAVYRGTGDTNDAASFVCRQPNRSMRRER